ncbi:efflux RND transporter periplasmic adaptor subunit [Amphritea sp. HPY]|uniref:efflux RND transporter periplasmic adaptor subunit n=1 Tax=Amphritea sp. HPY TaxID=3421652 RepID=UPI003D7D9F6E
MKSRKKLFFICLLSFLIMFVVPIRESIVVPGRLIPESQVLVRSGMTGAVDKVIVSLGEKVLKGDLLFTLDSSELEQKLKLALFSLEAAKEAYDKSARKLLSSKNESNQISVALSQAAVATKQAEVAYLRNQLELTSIYAPESGEIFYDLDTELLGRSVNAGQRLAVVATGDNADVEAWIPSGYLVEFPEFVDATFRSGQKPLIEAEIFYISHSPVVLPDGSVAYRMRAKVKNEQNGVTFGARGEVEVKGNYVPISLLLLRGPLDAIRKIIGL